MWIARVWRFNAERKLAAAANSRVTRSFAKLTIEVEVFIGHGAHFTYDRVPRAKGQGGALLTVRRTEMRVQP